METKRGSRTEHLGGGGKWRCKGEVSGVLKKMEGKLLNWDSGCSELKIRSRLRTDIGFSSYMEVIGDTDNSLMPLQS